jgi:outer membrane biosynthesis protein TonB
MRKLILIAAMVLASATAQAGSSRNLTVAANDQPAVAETKSADKTTEQPAAGEAPKFVERPAAVDAATETPKAEPAKPVAEKNVETPKVEKPKRKRMSTEARVIYELHRHGIYW